MEYLKNTDLKQSGPIEYKNTPLTFTLVLDGRREPVKVVEPEVDIPVPEGAKLFVHEAGRCLCDVRVHCAPAPASLYYELRFKVFKGVSYRSSKVVVFGGEDTASEKPNREYRMKIAESGAVEAWIVMAHRKARLLIHSHLPKSSKTPIPNSQSIYPESTL